MARCKDCLYFERCVVLGVELDMKHDKEADKNCRHFKNKADYKEVKHGYDTGECNIFKCSVCGYGVDDIYEDDETNYPVWSFNYCPHCGAYVRGNEDDKQ